MWDKEIKFVNDLFIKNNNCLKDFKQAFRRRDEHTSRVLKLAMNIVNSLDKDKKMFLDIDAISLTCIFHDVGIDNVDFRQSHGYRSSQIFESYAKENNFDPSAGMEHDVWMEEYGEYWTVGGYGMYQW